MCFNALVMGSNPREIKRGNRKHKYPIITHSRVLTEPPGKLRENSTAIYREYQRAWGFGVKYVDR